MEPMLPSSRGWRRCRQHVTLWPERRANILEKAPLFPLFCPAVSLLVHEIVLDCTRGVAADRAACAMDADDSETASVGLGAEEDTSSVGLQDVRVDDSARQEIKAVEKGSSTEYTCAPSIPFACTCLWGGSRPEDCSRPLDLPNALQCLLAVAMSICSLLMS